METDPSPGSQDLGRNAPLYRDIMLMFDDPPAWTKYQVGQEIGTLYAFGLEASDATVVQYDSSLGNGDPNEFAFEGISGTLPN